MPAGRKAQINNVFHAVFILLTLLFLMPLFENLSLCVLGSIVIYAMLRVMDYKGPMCLRALQPIQSKMVNKTLT